MPATPPSSTGTNEVAVVRSVVPVGLPYAEYRPYLRRDFFFCCAYCTMTEFEASAIRFTIDHYEPRTVRPDLKDDYYNLMYACDTCNLFKGDRIPSEDAKQNGFRFFRPDEDAYEDHFERREMRLVSRTNAGEFTIHALYLNRLELRRLREIRDRMKVCDKYVDEGIHALRQVKIDRLPTDVRARALGAINSALKARGEIANDLEEMLQQFAQSPFVGDHGTEEEQKERRKKLKQIGAIYPRQLRQQKLEGPSESA